jgi:hypothetical protein
LFGLWFGREAVVEIGLDGIADGFAPTIGAEGIGVFVLSEVNGLYEGLDHVGYGAGEPRFYVAAEYGGDEAA